MRNIRREAILQDVVDLHNVKADGKAAKKNAPPPPKTDLRKRAMHICTYVRTHARSRACTHARACVCVWYVVACRVCAVCCVHVFVVCVCVL